MTLKHVSIYHAHMAAGFRFWWTGFLSGPGWSVECIQGNPMSITRDDALAAARRFAETIKAEFQEPIERLDPCI